MEDKQVPERNFVREKIKNKPINHRRIAVKAAVAALCGIVLNGETPNYLPCFTKTGFKIVRR